MKILLIDDDPEELEILQASAENEKGLELEWSLASDELLHQLPHFESKPDLILLDWNMPGINGVEYMGKLKYVTKTPTILFTASLDPRIREEAMKVGFIDFIRKPDSLAEGSALLSRLCQQFHPS